MVAEQEIARVRPVPVYIRAGHLLTSGGCMAKLKFSSANVYAEDTSGSS